MISFSFLIVASASKSELHLVSPMFNVKDHIKPIHNYLDYIDFYPLELKNSCKKEKQHLRQRT